MTPRAFLELLWKDKPEEQYVLLWTLQDKRSRWFQDAPEAGEFAAVTGATHDVYVGIGLSKADHGPTRRCTSEEVSGLTGLGSDLDLQSEAHKKPLPLTIPDALTILPAAMPPSIVVATGNGVQPWWLLKEPLIFDSGEERIDAARVLARWHALLGRNAAARGWSYDRLSDLARILRIPGTLNHKDHVNPKPVTVLSVTDRRYNLSDFEEYLDQAGVPDVEAQEKAAREWAERFADKPLVVDLNRRIPQDRIDAWIGIDMRFRNTWNRQRHDLKDQSQSGYDLALACFGMDAGLSEQEIVTLIIHHRSLYSRTQRTRVDYFQRTISKATRAAGATADAGVIATLAPVPVAVSTTAPAPTPAEAPAGPPTTGDVAPQGAPVAPEVQPCANATTTPMAADTGAPGADGAEMPERDTLCADIAKYLKTPIVRLVKIAGKNPSYHMRLADGRVIEFSGFDKFTNQPCVHNAIGAMTNKHIPKFKQKAWEELSQRMLDACYIEEPTDEEDLVKCARLHVLNYLAETGFIPSIEGQRIQDQRKPIVIADGRIAVSTLDFQAYVNKTTFQGISAQQAASMLVAVGGKECRVTGRKYDQIRRALPHPAFDAKEIRPQEGEHAAAE
jgi:hypothetical protein